MWCIVKNNVESNVELFHNFNEIFKIVTSKINLIKLTLTAVVRSAVFSAKKNEKLFRRRWIGTITKSFSDISPEGIEGVEKCSRKDLKLETMAEFWPVCF